MSTGGKAPWVLELAPKSARRRRRRVHQLEQLERRDLLAAAIWHNAVFALDVTGDQPARVSLDALQVINWLNNPTLPRQLPRQVDQPAHGPFVDVNCDGRVSALDALLVINHLNLVGSGVVGGFFSDGGSYATAACSPQIIEGQGFATDLERLLKVPTSDAKTLEVHVQHPRFDTQALNQIRDAFELLVTDLTGNPLLAPLSASRAASFNWTEGYGPLAANGAELREEPADDRLVVSFDLSELPGGSDIRVIARLINNDGDDTTSVIIRGYEFVQPPAQPLPPSAGEGWPGSRSLPVSQFDIGQLEDLSGQVRIDYGRTSLSADGLQLVSQPRLTNGGRHPRPVDRGVRQLQPARRPSAAARWPTGRRPPICRLDLLDD